jgi:hypothetical protein
VLDAISKANPNVKVEAWGQEIWGDDLQRYDPLPHPLEDSNGNDNRRMTR